jgi:hypothetical protein
MHMRTQTYPPALQKFRWRKLAALLVTMITTMGIIMGSGIAANAVGGYHTAFSSIRVRAVANTQSAQVGTIGNTGTPIDITCQAAGETITAVGGTSGVWDKVSAYGGYISDLFVQETPYARFDSRIPRCETSTPPAASRESKAVSWAASEVGRYTDDWGRATAGWCARWSVGAYGRMNSGYATAWTMFNAFKSSGMIHAGAAPAGTFVFFQSAAVNGWGGHVAISDGAGGMYSTTNSNIKHVSLSYAGAPYVGWSYAPSGWTR